jgi:circadian clock protein KaiC
MKKLARRKIERVESGIAGFDRILRGGLLRGGLYMVRGAPGSGKTILGNQVCFSNARRGGQSAYVTLLAESHARMMMHLESLSFFDASLVGSLVQYVSGFSVLETGGLRGVLDLLRQELRTKKYSVLVIDGLVSLGESTTSATELKRFFQELQLHADLAGCTVLLLTGPGAAAGHAANTMVDGVFELREEAFELRAFRELRVLKFRGSDHLRGGHFFKIDHRGIAVFPRVEALYGKPRSEDDCIESKLSTGVRGLDAVLGGGLPGGTTTMVTGASGSGKTSLGLHFLAATPAGQKAVYFGFYETPERLRFKAKKLGLELERRGKRSNVSLLWQPSTEQNVDELVEKLLGELDRTGASRVFIDGLDGLQRATLHAERVHHIFTALANELRARNVTTLYSYEVPKFIGPDLEAPISGVSALVENLIYLRFIEVSAYLYRVLSILKVRETHYDPSLRVFTIGPRGIELEAARTSAEALLAGRKPDSTPAAPEATVAVAARRKPRSTR